MPTVGSAVVDATQGCSREVRAREEGPCRWFARSRYQSSDGVFLRFTVWLLNARLREIPQRCPGMGKTGHEAERGWFRAVGSGNLARSRCDKKMPRPVTKVVLHKRGDPGCQGGGADTFPAQECGAELVAGCSGRASVTSERQVGDGVEFGPLLSVK